MKHGGFLSGFGGTIALSVAGLATGFALVLVLRGESGRDALVSDAPAAAEQAATAVPAETEAFNSPRVADESGRVQFSDFTGQPMMSMGRGGPDRLPGQCEVLNLFEINPANEAQFSVSCETSVPGFGGLLRAFRAEEFLGKTVRFSADLRSENLSDSGNTEGMGSVWVRIDGASGKIANNARDQGIAGNMQWTRRAVEVTVPDDATVVSVGFWMQGYGRLEARNLMLEEI